TRQLVAAAVASTAVPTPTVADVTTNAKASAATVYRVSVLCMSLSSTPPPRSPSRPLDQSSGWTTISAFPSGSRTQNIGGTGPPKRETSASTSAPAAFNAAWSASTSVVSRQIPVSVPPACLPGGGGEIAICVSAPATFSS